MENTYNIIREKQLEWAKSHRIKTDAQGYTLHLKDNLFISLSEKSIREFSSGKGGELGEHGGRGKIQALHSSSALVVNFFEYWRVQNKTEIIAKACGAHDSLSEMHFEATHANPVGGIPPHLDVEFTGTRRAKPIAIESKFTECYHRHTKRTLSKRYVENKEIWKELPGCLSLANRIIAEEGKRTSFEYLDAPQLIKHILGLTTDPDAKGFQLIYLWYGVASPEAQKHWQELVEFESYIKDEVNFRVMTYQGLFRKLLKIADINQNYLSYLQRRYFSEEYNSFLDELIAYEDKYGCLVGNLSKAKGKTRSKP